MRTLIVNSGELAHLCLGEVREPLTGDDMSDRSSNVYPPGHGILIERGIIVQITDSQSLIAEYAPGWEGQRDISAELSVIDACGRAIVPGFVDSHTHLLWGGDRSSEMRLRQSGLTYRQIADLGGGIAKTVASTRSMSIEDLLSVGMSRLNHASSLGTTSMEVKSGYGLSVESELRLLEAADELSRHTRVNLFPTWLGGHDFPSDCTRSEYLDQLISEQLPSVMDQGIALWADVFCEPGWFSTDETEAIVLASKELGLPARLHVDEFEDSGGLALAADIGAVSADHVAKSGLDARKAASDSGTMQTFLPGTPYVMGASLDLPVQTCMEEEWAFSLATDFNPNCRILSIPFIGNLASNRMGMDPLAALVSVTRNPATTLRGSDVSGTLAVGSRADLNILWSESVDGWCQTPGENPISHSIIGGIIVNSS